MEQKTFVILGSHPNGKAFDFGRQDVYIMVFNEALATDWIKRADAVMQMHAPAIWRNPRNRNDPNHAAWLMSGETPTIYMQEHYPDVPKSVRYPLDEIVAQYPNFDKKYFTSSAAYAVALALYLGYKKIEMWGVEMETDTEYRYQRDGVAYWLGVAVGSGVDVCYYGGMFDAPLYGYEGDATLTRDDFAARIAQIAEILPAATAAYNAAKDAADKALIRYHDSGADADKLSEAIKAQVRAAYEYGISDGARQENERYIGKADAMIDAAGSAIFSRQEFEAAAARLLSNRTEAQQAATAAAGVAQQILQDAMETKNIIKRRKILRNKLAPALAEYIRQSIYAGIYTGAHAENITHLQKLDALVRAAGGAKSEAVLLGRS